MIKKVVMIAFGVILLGGTLLLAADITSPEQSRRVAFQDALQANEYVPTEKPEPESQASGKATFTVVNINDAGPGSLRDAIIQANAAIGHDLIDFNILGVGVQTISLQTPLPWLTDMNGVTIDGLTQPGASAGMSPPSTLQLMIEIDAIATGGGNHGVLVCNGANDTLQGLVIVNHEESGLSIISNQYYDAHDIVFRWNIIGLDPTGTFMKSNGTTDMTPPGWAGICVHNSSAPWVAVAARDNTIQENLISGNYCDGVAIIGPVQPGDVFNNMVIGNYIGTDITGTLALGNFGEGVCLCEGTHDNLVSDNLISFNALDGVGIQGFPQEPEPIVTWGNTITNNRIGINVTGMPAGNGHHGVVCGEYGGTPWGCAPGNNIRDNVIANNGTLNIISDGVAVTEVMGFCDFNLITQNSIYDNIELGIDLQNDGVTPNDPGDPDDAGNIYLNFPVIISAIYSGGATAIAGTIDIDTDPSQATVEVFKARIDPTGYGEGEIYLGSATPDIAGNWSLVLAGGLAVGDWVTATTTDLNNNTSEFCENVQVREEGPDPWDCELNPPPDKLGGGWESEPNNDCTIADYAECEHAYCGDIIPENDQDWWVVTLPPGGSDECYCLHVRVFADATPGTIATGGGLDSYLEIYAADCTTLLYSQNDNWGLLPDAEGTDSQYDCQDAGNCYHAGTTLYIKVSSNMGMSEGPYLLVINCYDCVCPNDPWDCDLNPPTGKLGGGLETETNDNCMTANSAQCEYAYCGDIWPTGDEDWWELALPTAVDVCYNIEVRVFADDTPGQYAYLGGLDPHLEVFGTDCTTLLFSNDDYNGTFPDAVGADAQYDYAQVGNCYPAGTILYLRITSTPTGAGDSGPYLLVINCQTCTCPQTSDLVVCEPQPPTHPPHYWYEVTPEDNNGRCDFHVKVFDSDINNYSNWVDPAGWQHNLHQVGGDWWVSWWNVGCTDPIYNFAPKTFGFDNSNPSVWSDWTITVSGSNDDPFNTLHDQSSNHTTDPDGYGYRVHVPLYEGPHEYKWAQPPDLEPTGMDINATIHPPFIEGNVLADDFECFITGPLTQIVVYGSWFNDWGPMGEPCNVIFRLSIHSDIPVGPDGWSIPENPPLWTMDFIPGQFDCELYMGGILEGFYWPEIGIYEFPGDTQCWKYTFHLDPLETFIQQGTEQDPVIYWLDVQAFVENDVDAFFGWKTTHIENQWNDDAVWALGIDPPLNPWIELLYPVNHPWEFASLDLAFEIYGEEEPQDRGACCHGIPNFLCTIETQADCEGNGWKYMGDGTSCVPDPCTTCCIPPSVGDLDQSGGALGFNYDGADLSLMINGLFIDPANGFNGICLDEADVDFTCFRPCDDKMKIDGADLSLLINALFIAPAPSSYLNKCDGSTNP